MGRPSAPPINGERIRQARIDRFLTQSDVQRMTAELGCEIDRGNLSKIENGKLHWPRPKSVPVLAAVLGLEVEELYRKAA